MDLDLGQGMFTLPGTLAATVVERPLDPVEGISLDAPLIYYYGAATPSDNPEHFQYLVGRLAKVSMPVVRYSDAVRLPPAVGFSEPSQAGGERTHWGVLASLRERTHREQDTHVGRMVGTQLPPC